MRTLSQKLINSCRNGSQLNITDDIGTDQLLFKVGELATDYLQKPLASWTTTEKTAFEDFFNRLRHLDPNYNRDSNQSFTIQNIVEKVEKLARRLRGKNYRKGSKVDAEALSKTFRGFGYEVRPHRNLTAAQLRQTLKDLAKEKGPNGESIFKGYASLVVCLLSHGGLGTVCGVDNEEVKFLELQYEIFNSESCPDLNDKPKIFIIQACQGNRKILHDPPVDNVVKENDNNQSSASAMGPPSGGSGSPTKRAQRVKEMVAHGGPTGSKRAKKSLFPSTAGILLLIFIIFQVKKKQLDTIILYRSYL